MAAKFKKLSRGVGKLRGGKVGSGKKLRISNFVVKPTIGTKQLLFEADVTSEFPSQRSRQAAQQRSKIGKKTSSNPRGVYSYDGKSPPAKQYKVSILFEGISFKEEPDEQHTVPVQFRGKQYYYKIPELEKVNSRVKCMCPDARFSYEWHNAKKEKAHIGNPRTYKRVTPAKDGDLNNPSTYKRPPSPKNPNPYGHDFVNPKGYVGFCKHIFNFKNFLRENKYARG